jgi:hypothetical protein
VASLSSESHNKVSLIGSLKLSYKCADQFIVLTFIDSNANSFKLKYQLYDHSLCRKWVSLMLQDHDKRKIEEGGVFYGKRFHSEKELEIKMNECIGKINHYAKQFNSSILSIPLVARIPMTIEFLNEAHKYFEKIAPLRTINLIPELRRVVEDLNVTIHQAEAFTSLGDFPTEHIEVVLIPRASADLDAEDFNLFTANNKFGELYLSYGTIGVPTKNAYLVNTDPVPQKVFSTGVMLSFMDDFEFIIDDKFRNWLAQKNLSAENPRSSIGSIPLGILVDPVIVNRDEFLSKLGNLKEATSVYFE